MTSVPQLGELLKQMLEEESEVIGREVGFVKRERELSSADFVQMLIFGWLQEPEITLEGLSQVVARREVQVTGSAVSQRFGPEAAELLRRVLERLSEQVLEVEAVDVPLLRQFSAVIIEDSTSIVLPDELAEVWRGCGGSAGTSEAAIKLFVRWDVLGGRLEGPGLADGRCSDQRGPLALTDLPVGCLYLADLGFFGVPRLAQLAGTGRRNRRYFESRYQPKTSLLTRSGHRIDLRGLLPQPVGGRVEFGALLGAAGRLPVRVLIERVPAEVAEGRRARLREKAQAHGRQPDEEVLFLADWSIVLTNVPRRLLSAEQVLVLLRLRWQIERLFRLWKEDGLIDQWRSKKPARILCELYAKLCAMLIQQWLITLGCWQDVHRSLVKAAQVCRREAGRLMVALYEGGLETVLTGIVRCLRSGSRLNPRRQFPNTSQFLLGTPLGWPKPRAKPRSCP